MVARQIGIAVSGHYSNRIVSNSTGENPKQFETCLVRPVQVIKHQKDASRPGQVSQKIFKCAGKLSRWRDCSLHSPGNRFWQFGLISFWAIQTGKIYPRAIRSRGLQVVTQAGDNPYALGREFATDFTNQRRFPDTDLTTDENQRTLASQGTLDRIPESRCFLVTSDEEDE